MRLPHSYGIDMGADSVRIFDLRADKIVAEANCAAVREDSTVFAVGDAAASMIGRSPANIRVVTPIANGRISDVMLMEAVLHTLLAKCSSRTGLRPTLLYSVPLHMTEIERRAYYSIAHKGRLRHGNILFVERPFADALAADGQVRTYRGRMIVNMGAQTTEISVLSGAHIIFSHLHPVGGNAISEGIAEAVRLRHRLQISPRTARWLKEELGGLDAQKEGMQQVEGLDDASGLPRNGTVPSRTVEDAVRGQIDAILEEVQRSMERTPPQIRAIIREEGILVSGGCARIPGIGAYMQTALDCPVRVSEHYETTTVRGLAAILRDEKLQELTFGLAR